VGKGHYLQLFVFDDVLEAEKLHGALEKLVALEDDKTYAVD
jgi:hypothetical protein